jgi:signal transduction histidine kinase
MTAAVAHAVIDLDGLLVSADPAIASLNRRAGGAEGQMLAVPQLATVARLARRLGIVVARRVVVADDESDVALWVRAQPEGGQVRLATSGWGETPAWSPIDDVPDAVPGDGRWRWETDATLRLTFVSLDAGALYGFDPLGMLGKPLSALFGFAENADGAMPILNALARRRVLKGQAAVLKPNGRSVVLSARPRVDALGEFAGLVGSVAEGEEPVAVDVEETLPASFTQGLDRALRGPLARIVANADSIHAQADGPITPGYADYAADIASAGRHLLSLVDDLVDLQAIERAEFRPTIEPIDLADVARRAAGLLTVRADMAGVTIDRPRFDDTVPALGDFRRALQILVNLVGNAVRYTDSGGNVRVETALVGDRAQVTVIDAGKGIAPEDQARIFDKFERVDPTEPGGNGLGLFIARRLARAMGGDLTVASVPGEGAQFTLSLPTEL